MSGIDIPVTAPGSTNAAREMLLAADAAKKLTEQEAAFAAGARAFEAAAAKEAAALNTKVTPALIRARQEAATYAAMMKSGQGGMASRFLSQSSIVTGMGGGGGEHGEGIGHMLHQFSRATGRGGGEAGHLLHTVGRLAMLNPAIAVAAGSLIALAMVGHHLYEKEEERLKKIGEEAKVRADLTKAIEEATHAEEDRARKGYEGQRGARNIIVGGARDAYEAKDRIRELGQTGDPDAMKAMAKFMQTRNGKRLTWDNAMGMAKDISSTGVASFSEALGEMGNAKGSFSVGSLVADRMGQHGKKFSNDELDDMRRKQTEYGEVTGSGFVDRVLDKNAAELAATFQDMDKVLTSSLRELSKTMDPVGTATREFAKGLNEALIPLKAMADAENRVWKNLVHVFGKSHHDEYEEAKKSVANEMR